MSRKAFTVHEASAAELPKNVPVIWNDQDALIAMGTTAGSSQGAYVTIYGIPPDLLPECKRWQVGTEHDVDLSLSRVSWRATRFGVGFVHPDSDVPMYEWHRLAKIPDGVKTLAQLCRHLVKLDAIAYPEVIYGEENLAKAVVGNPACMLFDHWYNRQFRHATIQSPWDWDTYTKNAGSIGVVAEKGEGAAKSAVPITHVLRFVSAPPKQSAAPGGTGQKAAVDDVWGEVLPYVASLTKTSDTIATLMKTIENVTEERMAVITQLEVLRQVATHSGEYGVDMSAWNTVREKTEKLVGALQTQLMAMPIDTTAIPRDVFDPSKATFAAIATPDGHKTLESSRDALRSLLMKDSKFASATSRWAAQAHAGLLRGDPTVKARLDVLSKAMAAAWYALGNTGNADDDLPAAQQMFDQATAGHALKAADVKGTSSSELLLSLIGKSSKMPEAYGLIEGPQSFRAAAATSWATWRYQTLAAESAAELAALPAGTKDAALNMAKWKAFGEQLVDHLPEGEVRTKVMQAVAGGKVDGLAALKTEVLDEVGKEFPQPAHFAGALLILNFIGTVLSIRETAGKPANRATILKAIDWADATVGVASVTLGTMEYLLKASSRQVPKLLTKAINFAAGVGAVLAILKGAAGFYQATEKDDPLGAVGALSEMVGGAAALVVVVAAIYGTTVPIAGQIALICLLVTGTISVADIARTSMPTPNQFVVGLLTSASKSDLFKYAAARDGNIKGWVSDIMYHVDISVNPTKSVPLRYFANDVWNVQSLRRLGLADGHIEMLVNHQGGGLANTPFGPGPLPPGAGPAAGAPTSPTGGLPDVGALLGR